MRLFLLGRITASVQSTSTEECNDLNLASAELLATGNRRQCSPSVFLRQRSLTSASISMIQTKMCKPSQWSTSCRCCSRTCTHSEQVKIRPPSWMKESTCTHTKPVYFTIYVCLRPLCKHQVLMGRPVYRFHIQSCSA